MKTKRFDFNFKPLQINVCMSVEGSVPDAQNYDADADEYTPDYTITPLIIQPGISRLDKDEILSAGRVNQDLANIRWYEVAANGTKTLIEASNTSYEITASGGTSGRIKVKKNAKPQLPINLLFTAEYTDTRTNQIHTLQASFQVQCKNATSYIPQLVLDAAPQTIYDPLTDEDTQVVHASLKLGASECPAANRLFVWEKFRSDNTWTQVGTDTTLDYDVSVSSDGTTCTVNRSLMGTELYLRCRAKYDKNGTPSGVTLGNSSPERIISFIRRIPKYEYEISGLPVNIPAGILSIAPEAKIWNTKGDVDNPEKELLPLWYIATNKQSGSLSYSQIAHGVSPILPTDALSDLYGAVVGLDVKDVGPTCAWEDSDGKLFEDSDGKLILIK